MRRRAIGTVLAGLVALGAWGEAQAQDPEPGLIGSISGRIVDLPTREPLASGPSGLAGVQLVRCGEQACDQVVNVVAADAQGAFALTTNSAGSPIEAGLFFLLAFAPEHTTLLLELDVAPGQHLDLGDLRLPVLPVQILDLEPCTSIPSEGGRCVYTARVRNNTGAVLVGTASSIVMKDASSAEPLSFEASTRPGDPDVRRARLRIPRLDSQQVEFSFDVPPFAADGTQICAFVIFGVDPAPLFDIRAARPFCIEKGSSGLWDMSPAVARALERTSAMPGAGASRVDVDDPALDLSPVQFSNLQPCTDVPATGGTCSFSVDILNDSNAVLRATARGLVAFTNGGTLFEASSTGGSHADVTRTRIKIRAGERSRVTFSFEIPDYSNRPLAPELCTELYLGYEPSPFFNPARSEPMFCLRQSDAGYEVTLADAPQS